MLSATLMLILRSGLAFAHPAVPGAQAAILDRMDRAASQFHGMTADIKHTSHTEVINENSVATGRVKMRKVRAGSVEGLIDFTTPDAKTYLFVKRTAKIYTPASRTVEVIDLGKHGEQLDQFLMIGFGTSRADLERGYAVKLEGQEKLDGRDTEHLVLTPRSKEAAQYVLTVDLWVASDNGYPVREKVLQPSRDWVQVDYSNVVINPPLKDGDFTLKLPKDVQTIYPQK